MVHEGWGHLQHQRPLAAWAAWQRALRIVPEYPQAVEALARLEAASDLPVSARIEYRFQTPVDPTRRTHWDSLIRQGGLEDLDKAADVFAALSVDDPNDAAAWFNRALCLAWTGRNAESISCLDRVVQLQAAESPDHAVTAWTLAEILRQGGGAEALADDLRYVWIVPWTEAETSRLRQLGPTLERKPAPLDPVSGGPTLPTAEVYEWLDRPMPEASPTLALAELPRVLATVILTPDSLRLSNADPAALEQLREPLSRVVADLDRLIKREAGPLPLALADAAVWTYRRPQGLDGETDGRLAREAVEHYYENVWIHQPRHGLENRSPLQAGRVARAGDAAAGVRLAAVVRLCEQYGARPRAAALYQGYPFDRLRRRLGLVPLDPASFDADDASCMSEEELDRLDLAAFAGPRLAEAYLSAAAFGDDRRTAKFAAALVNDAGSATHTAIQPDLFAVLVREALRVDRPDEARRWLGLALDSHGGRDRLTYEIWCAEIDARTGEPEAALARYLALIQENRLETSQLLDAAEDLSAHGHHEYAVPLLDVVQERVGREDDPTNRERARLLGDDALHDPSAR